MPRENVQQIIDSNLRVGRVKKKTTSIISLKEKRVMKNPRSI